MKKSLVIIIAVFVAMAGHSQKFEGLAQSPPMGWNSWNTFAVNINEKLVKEMADAMVSSGMRDAGYTYLVLDDAWMAKERDANGNLVPDPQKFPGGMKAVADYIHAKGLKFGLYNCAGTLTCGGYPSTRGYEYQDARFYASLGVDYLKFDWCNTEGINAKEAYATMSKALKAAHRPVVFSLCEWGNNKPWEWAKDVGHLWRTTGDIYNCFDCIVDHGTWKQLGVMPIVDLQEGLRVYAGPGHWNDPDMLEVGNGMSVNEDRAHFSLWCMLAAPLIAGNDLRKMSAETVAILIDKEAIAISQDAMGIEAYSLQNKDSLQIFVKPLQNKELAVCFLNRATRPQSVSFDWKQNPVKDSLSGTSINFNETTYDLYNIWSKKNAGSTAKSFNATIPAHDVVLLRLSGQKK